MRYAIVNAHV